MRFSVLMLFLPVSAMLIGCARTVVRYVDRPVPATLRFPAPPECLDVPNVLFTLVDGHYCTTPEGAERLIARELLRLECLAQWRAWAEAVCRTPHVECVTGGNDAPGP